MRDQKITRRELYELVWSMPMTKLAAEFSISDVGLKKTCERHRVPTPPRGYWAKIEAGQKPKQALFIEVQDVGLNQVKIGASTVPLPEPVRRIIEERKAERQSKIRHPREPVPSTFEPIVTAHPAVRRTVEALRRCKSTEASANAAGDGLCGVAVGRGNVERAVFILDSMARLLADKGLHLEPKGNGIQVQAGPDVAIMVLGERTRTVDHIPTVDELNAEARREEQRQRHWQNPSRWPLPPYGRAYPEKDIVWSGQLFIQIEGYSDGVRRRWADGRTQQLECLIHSIVDGIEVLLAARKAQREDREEQARQWAELRRRRELARLRQDREKVRTEFFNYLVKLQRDTNDLQTALNDLAIGVSSIDCAQISRMMKWGEARLRELQGELQPEAVEKRLIEKKLFPAENEDELLDPLGDPDPPSRFW